MHTPTCLRDEAKKYRRLAAGILRPEIVDQLEKTAAEFELRAIEIERNPSGGGGDSAPDEPED